jgi:hypothetical protein
MGMADRVYLVTALGAEIMVAGLCLKVSRQLQAWRIGGAARWVPLAVATGAAVRGWGLVRQGSGPAGTGWLTAVAGAALMIYVVWRFGQYWVAHDRLRSGWPQAAEVLQKTGKGEADERDPG